MRKENDFCVSVDFANDPKPIILRTSHRKAGSMNNVILFASGPKIDAHNLKQVAQIFAL